MIKENEIKRFSFINILIYISILMISIFPIFGNKGFVVQKYALWITISISFIYYLLKKGLIVNRFTFIYLLYILFCAISIVWSKNITGAYIRLVDMIRAVLFMIVISSSCRNKDEIFKYLDIYTIGVVLISIYCMIIDMSSLTVWARLGQKSFELAGQNQIYYSCILIYATMYSVYRVFVSKEKKFKYIVITIFLFVCCLLTAIRKCLFIPAIFFFIYMLISNRKNFIKQFFYITIIVCVFGLIFVLINKYFPSMSKRLISIINDYSNNVQGYAFGNSYANRKWLRELAWQTFLGHPIVGVGIGQFRYYAAVYGVDVYSHNNFLEVLANTGIIGFNIYYSSFLFLLIRLFKSDKDEYEKRNYDFILAFIIAAFFMEYGQVEYYQLFFLYVINLFSIYLEQKKYSIYFCKKEY